MHCQMNNVKQYTVTVNIKTNRIGFENLCGPICPGPGISNSFCKEFVFELL
jgi:hypothetical protein